MGFTKRVQSDTYSLNLSVQKISVTCYYSQRFPSYAITTFYSTAKLMKPVEYTEKFLDLLLSERFPCNDTIAFHSALWKHAGIGYC